MSLDENTRRDHFLAWMKARGENTSIVTKRAGVSYSTLASFVQGDTRSLRGDTEAKIAAAYETSVGVIFNGEADEAPPTVPVVGYVQAGALANLFAEGQGPFDQVPAPAHASTRTVAVEVRGDSMGGWMDRSLVFYDDVRSPVTPDLFGKLCVVGLPDGRVLVKELRPSSDPGAYHLISLTEGPILDQPVDWAARVTSIAPR